MMLRSPITDSTRFTVAQFLSLLLVTSAGYSHLWATLPAFPGAEGFGSTTPGGRGGRVIEVTNLNASGPGSLDAACRASGRRIVVFRTGGIINLNEKIVIKSPYITIAGQTAPGGGICIRGAQLAIQSHDVIVRGLRIRVGDGPGYDPDNRDGIEILAARDVVIDHCSVSWAFDENVITWYACRDVTVQWCIISEGLYHALPGGGGWGLLIGNSTRNLSVHHCLLAHNGHRNPKGSPDTSSEIVNNVAYNWDWNAATDMGNPGGPVFSNVIGNFFRRGPNTHKAKHVRGVRIRGSSHPSSRLYVKGNIGPYRSTDTGDEWLVVQGDSQFRSPTPVIAGSGLTVYSPTQAFEMVLAHAGATAPARDAVDRRIVRSVCEGTGKLIKSQDEVGGWPNYAPGTASPDTDHDGMPDSWEQAHGLDPRDPKDRNHFAPSKYTWVEEYVNSLIPLPDEGSEERREFFRRVRDAIRRAQQNNR